MARPQIIIKIKDHDVDVVQIIEKYCYIIDADSNFIPLVLNKPQLKLLTYMAEDWNNHRPLRYIILKARQMGFSTVIEAFIFVVTMFQPNQRSAIVADCAENASSLFDMSKLYYDSFEAGILPALKNKSGKLLATQKTNSSIRVLAASDNTGRSKSLQWVHASEFAFWADPESVLTALLRTVSITNSRSGIFIESTAKGFNAFKNRWDKAVAKKSPYRPVFFAWWELDRYRLDYIFDDSPHTPEEDELIRKYNLDEAQVQWRRWQIADMDGDIQKFNQEYPACPEDAFIATGFSVFDNKAIVERKQQVDLSPERGFFTYDKRVSLDGNKITISNIKWNKAPYGEIAIYRQPMNNFPYVLGGDPANGGADSFVGQVINNVNKEQVAIYDKVGVDPDLYAFQLYCLGRMFNWALIGTEVNITGSVMKILAKCGYPNLYVRETVDSTGLDYLNSYGVKTTPITKPIMIDTFKAIFRENPNVINDYLTLCEMETFEVVDTPGNNTHQTTKAQAGKHDDTVMALAIAYYISSQQTTYVKKDIHKESVDSWVTRSIAESRKGYGYNLWKN